MFNLPVQQAQIGTGSTSIATSQEPPASEDRSGPFPSFGANGILDFRRRWGPIAPPNRGGVQVPDTQQGAHLEATVRGALQSAKFDQLAQGGWMDL